MIKKIWHRRHNRGKRATPLPIPFYFLAKIDRIYVLKMGLPRPPFFEFDVLWTWNIQICLLKLNGMESMNSPRIVQYPGRKWFLKSLFLPVWDVQTTFSWYLDLRGHWIDGARACPLPQPPSKEVTHVNTSDISPIPRRSSQ